MRLRSVLLTSACCLPVMATGALAQDVGVSAAVNQSARGTPPSQQVRTISLGDRIIHDELVETDAGGLLQILLADGTTFTVGGSSSLKIDSFVYDPNAGTASVSAAMSKGVFRFIGGQTSKTPGGTSIDTPVGTVGIRGAIVDFDFSGLDPADFHIDMRYGDEVTLTLPNGVTLRLYQPGYSILFDKGKARIGKTLKQMTIAFQKAISGKTGKQGGAPKKPTNEMVAASGIGPTNSGKPGRFIPIPTPRPDPVDDATGDANRQAQRDVVKDVTPGEGSGLAGAPIRILTAAGGTAPDGILGGTPGTDQATTIVTEDGASQGAVDLAGGTVTLPVYDGSAFAAHTLSGIESPYGTLSGTAYSGAGGFAAYLLGVDGDPSRPFYAVTGTGTDTASVFQGNGVRSYGLTADPLQGVAVPFMTDNPAFDFDAAEISDLKVAEASDMANGARAFQTWLTIDGTGTDQTSAIGVNVGALGADGLTMDRRGSYRTDSGGPAYTLFGNAGTLGNGAGASIFGPDGENFVISDDMPGEPGHFYDSPADGSMDGGDFATTHVGNLEGTATPTRSLSGTYGGFVAGLVTATQLDNAGNPLFADTALARNASPDTAAINFDPSRRSIGGVFILDLPYGDQLRLRFGDDLVDDNEDGASAYIDDDTFGASAVPGSAGAETAGEGGSQVQLPGMDAGTYVVSSNAVDMSDADFMSPVDADHRCGDCSFLKWGWWGTQARMADSGDDQEDRRLGAHLGTWVVGDIADVAEVDGLPSGSDAHYRGLAVGNVVSDGAAYVAAGEMNMDYNFGTRTGDMDIDIDGRSLTGAMTGAGSGRATFGGSWSGGTINGGVDGAFVNNGDEIGAGVIGNFDAETSVGDWGATGIIAGERYIPSN